MRKRAPERWLSYCFYANFMPNDFEYSKNEGKNFDEVAAVAKELEFEPGECFVNIVTVDAEEYAKKHFDKAVKKTLTIPAWLNTAAMEQGINFSKVLQDALKKQLNLG